MQQKKIPTVLGILLVFGMVFLFSLAFNRVAPLLSRASPTLAPKNVTFSNIGDASFTISWITAVPTTGAVIIDGNGIGTLYDERDESKATNTSHVDLGSYTVHSVVVRNTKPQTTYHVRILSGDNVYQDGINPYSVTTGATIAGTGISLEPAFGTVTLPNGQPPPNAIVYLTPQGGQTLSAFVTPSGSWVVPLHLARTADLSNYLTVQNRIDESIIIRTPDGQSDAQTDTLNDNPVPPMVIGKSYDFRKQQAHASPSPLAEAKPAVLGDSTQISQNVAITQPAQGAHLTATLPAIQGTGAAGQQVLVIVGITNPQSGVTTVGGDGIWRFTPNVPLSEGKQSVTITTKDINGKTTALTNTFEIFKSGTQVLGDATPSATLTPTLAASPSAESSLAGQPPPTTGDETPTIMLLLLGSVLFVGGTALFIL